LFVIYKKWAREFKRAKTKCYMNNARDGSEWQGLWFHDTFMIFEWCNGQGMVVRDV